MAEQVVNMKKNKTNRKEFNLFDGKESVRYLHLCKEIKISSEKVEGRLRKEEVNNQSTKEKQNARSDDVDTSKTDGKSCLLCDVTFSTLEEQRGHFKLDWHKYNIKQRLLLKDPVKESVFEEIISGDLSSISGSDSESEEEALTTANPEDIPLMTLSLFPNERKIHAEESVLDRSNPKVYFISEDGIYLSVYREVVYGTKEELTREEIETRIQNLPKEKFWLILMTGGGHFAGAIFSGNDVVVSKTFHRYTVRAKRGTAQGVRDTKQGGHAPKSAGASLRRYNEAALVQDIQNLLESWREHIEKCSNIFMRVPNNYKWIFFGGKNPPFGKDDLRIRVIPFATRRATFKELKNVHKKLSTVIINENSQQTTERVGNDRPENKAENTTYDSKVVENLGNTKQDSVDATNTIEEEMERSGDEQRERELVKSLVKKNPKNESLVKKEKQKTNAIEQRKKEVIPEVWIELYEAVKSGNLEKTTNIIKKLQDNKHEYETISSEDQEDSFKESRRGFDFNESNTELQFTLDNIRVTKPDVKTVNKKIGKCDKGNECVKIHEMINRRFESFGETLLHVATWLGQSDIIKILLEAGASPTIKDLEGRLPYNVAKEKETRNVFRRFMAVYPDRYDYNQARIPSALTSEMEEKERQKTAEKKKAQSKARKQRLKEKKAEKKLKEEEKLRKEKEENEKKWFQNLSDREKRAVAAERRLGNICFNCGRSLQGLVPFERHSNKYCSTECVHKHRKIMETAVI